jgi:hypothetical protein
MIPLLKGLAIKMTLIRTVGKTILILLAQLVSLRAKKLPSFAATLKAVVSMEHSLHYTDKKEVKEVFDCFTGLCPFLLLDGHSSQFDLEFLEYINSEETKWNVNIGLPYGTSCWQVGD